MGVKIKLLGSTERTRKFLENAAKEEFLSHLNEYGRKGVDALAAASPKKTGELSRSWDYYISKPSVGNKNKTTELGWTNSKMVGVPGRYQVPLAILLQYGHESKSGKWVDGVDYINPAMQKVFDDIVERAWAKLTKKWRYKT